MKNCIICGRTAKDDKTLYDDRYGYPGMFQLVRCTSCGHKYLQAGFTPEELTNLYTDYYPRSTYELDHYQPYKEISGFSAWLNGDYSKAFYWIPKNVRILDIGCGFGETLGYHKARGCDVYGVEADANIKRVADKFGYKVHIGLFDTNNYETAFFDYVTLDQVIEHIANPVEILRGISRVLKPGGVLILSTPNASGWGSRVFNRRWIHWHAPYHLQLFSEESMKLAAEQAGLSIEKVKTVTSSDWLFFQWNHLLTRPIMGKPSVFWKPNAKRSFIQSMSITMMNWIHLLKINHVITRCFDALGIGDNYLFVLRKK